MVLTALRGAVGFLTTLPVSVDDDAWEAFRRHPGVLPFVGYPIGGLVALPVLVASSAPLGGFGFVLAIFVVTGINHFDGLTDFADGLAVHGAESERVDAMRDSALGVGGLLAGGIVLLGLFVAGQSVAAAARGAVALIVTAEVAAKLAMLIVLSRGTPRHDGLGSALAEFATTRSLLAGVALSMSAAVLTWPSPVGILTLATGPVVAMSMGRVARRRLGGISGDVLGATNEIARLAALLVGVIGWTHW
ncbi:MAG: adenosylcobinamide-GDP ribazoletransferase [Halanaeroarchaeum sp.]